MNGDKLLELAKSNLETLQKQWDAREEYIDIASKQTTTILDSLDNDLEKLETKALGTFNDVKSSFVSWWGAPATPVALQYTPYITNGAFNARVIVELQNLESDIKSYAVKHNDYKLSDDQLAELDTIKAQENLHILSTLSQYEDEDKESFWKSYFFNRSAIVEKDKARKEMLKPEAKEDDEEFNWDDEEE